MPRRTKQERKIGKHSKAIMEMALKAFEAGSSIRQAGKYQIRVIVYFAMRLISYKRVQ